MADVKTCGKCADGWICEAHPEKPWPHDDCGGPGMPCDNPGCPYSIEPVNEPTQDRGSSE